MNRILTLVFCCLATWATAQTDLDFPKAFEGQYAGTLHIHNKSGHQEVDMEFHLLPTDQPDRWEYVIVYVMDSGRQERHYTLIEQNKSTGEYLIDENNGIVLFAQYVDRSLYSMFDVQGNRLTTSLTFSRKFMEFQILFANDNQAQISGSGDINVNSVPVTVVQRATLKKRLED